MQLHSRRFLRRNGRNLDLGKLQPVPEKVHSDSMAFGSALAPRIGSKKEVSVVVDESAESARD